MDPTDTLPSEAIKLNFHELEVISDPTLVNDAETAEFPNIVYGRMITGKPINKQGLKYLFVSLWQNSLGVEIEDYTDGIITLTFESEVGKNGVLRGQPWHFVGSYLILVEAEATVQITPELFRQILFWVQVSGIPPGHLIKPYGAKLGRFSFGWEEM